MTIILILILLTLIFGLSWPIAPPFNQALAIIFAVIAILVLLGSVGVLGHDMLWLRGT